MSIRPLPSASPALHADTGTLPSAMLTMVSSSSIPTAPEESQSPTHGLAVRVAVGAAGVVGAGVEELVAVAGGVAVAVADSTLPVRVALGETDDTGV